MPKELERKLARDADKKGLKGKAKDRLIYGTMNKLGLMKGNKTIKKKKTSK